MNVECHPVSPSLRTRGKTPEKPSGPFSRQPRGRAILGRPTRRRERSAPRAKPQRLIYHSRDIEVGGGPAGSSRTHSILPSPQKGGTAPDARRGASAAAQGAVARPGGGSRAQVPFPRFYTGLPGWRIMRLFGSSRIRPRQRSNRIRHIRAGHRLPRAGFTTDPNHVPMIGAINRHGQQPLL
jgi:hypothetical protein